MKVIVFLLLILAANAKRCKLAGDLKDYDMDVERCKLARALKAYDMDVDTDVSLDDWVCLTYWESRFKTQAINHNMGGSTDYGIFQINSRYWCYDGETPGRTSNGCNINCSDLLSDDDISLSVNCAKIIARQQGISAWYGWRNGCQDCNVTLYIEGCGV